MSDRAGLCEKRRELLKDLDSQIGNEKLLIKFYNAELRKKLHVKINEFRMVAKSWHDKGNLKDSRLALFFMHYTEDLCAEVTGCEECGK